MKLRYSSASPFVRKVLIMAQETGLLSRIDVLPADPFGDDLSDIEQHNPLGKVPALITEQDGAFVNSYSACEYLDSLHDGPKFLPANGPERWKVQQLHGLADGILDAAVGQVYEVVRRPAQYSYPQNSARLTNKINKALDYLESQVADFDAALNLGSITLVCALDYLDFRLSEAIDWRANRPSLEAWHDRLSDRPSFKQTLPHL
jgi:glutathione S-transferase|tara:strand:+ start:1558 stop:2169 length:612 start_codon:yes stop_codon:yes gene_type:complete